MTTILSNNSDLSTSNAGRAESEGRLLHIAHWAIWSMRVPGYLLFTVDSVDPTNEQVYQKTANNDRTQNIVNHITNSKLFIFSTSSEQNQFYSSSQNFKMFNLLHFKSLLQLNLYAIYISLWFAASFSVTMFSLYKGYDILIQFGNAASHDNFQVFSEVSDRFLAMSNIIAMGGFLLIFRIFFLKKSATLQFWKNTVNLYHEFRLNYFHDQTFEALRGELSSDALWHWPMGILHSGCCLLLGIYANFRREDMSVGTVISWVICIIIINCHIGLTIWIGFFIRFYSMCFRQLKMCISSSPSTSSPDFITLSNGNLEILNSPNTNNYEILERLMDLFELVYESVENFNKFYAFALIVDMFIGLINALATVYQINRVTYESSRASWEDTVFVLIKIPMHCVYVLRLFYLINLGETMTTEGLGVLRSLQRTNTASILSGGAGGGVLLAKVNYYFVVLNHSLSN